MSDDRNPDEILRPADVARWLKTSRNWPYVMAARGLLPCYKMGTTNRQKLLRFRRGDIEEFLQRARTKKCAT